MRIKVTQVPAIFCTAGPCWYKFLQKTGNEFTMRFGL
jgi:hypothetical protein